MDFPIKHGDFPVRYVSHYQRVLPQTLLKKQLQLLLFPVSAWFQSSKISKRCRGPARTPSPLASSKMGKELVSLSPCPSVCTARSCFPPSTTDALTGRGRKNGGWGQERFGFWMFFFVWEWTLNYFDHFVEVHDFWPALKMGGEIDLFKSKADDLKPSLEDFIIF